MPASPSPESFLPVSAVVFDILLALAGGDLHGYDIMREVDGRNGGRVTLHPGTLYRALHRLLNDGLVEELDERPDPALDDERRRYYRLTRFGKRVAAAEVDRLNTLVRQARATGLVPGA
jgi:DNA-binding PadR family transcriptional regulator